MGACCSSGPARDSHDTNKTIMPAPTVNERPKSGLSKLQTFRYQVHSKPNLQKPTQPETENLLDNRTLVDENRNSSASERSRSIPSLNSTESNQASSSMNRFGFGFKAKAKPENKNLVDRGSKDSGKGSVESLDNRFSGTKKITPSNSTSSLSKLRSKETSKENKKKISSSKSLNSTSAKSSDTSLTSQKSPPLQRKSVDNKPPSGLKAPGFRSTVSPNDVKAGTGTGTSTGTSAGTSARTGTGGSSITAVSGTGDKTADNVTNRMTEVDKKAVVDSTDSASLGYRGRVPIHGRGPLLARLQQTTASKSSTSSDPYPSTSLPRVNKHSKVTKPSFSGNLGSRTVVVPNQLSFNKRVSIEACNTTPDSMTTSAFSTEAPLATFDSLGSTSFMSVISMASDDMMLDFEFEEEKLPGVYSVASTPGDEKSIEQQFLAQFSSSTLRKPTTNKSKSIETPRKRSHGKSPLVIDSTKNEIQDDSAYVSCVSESATEESINRAICEPANEVVDRTYTVDDHNHDVTVDDDVTVNEPEHDVTLTNIEDPIEVIIEAVNCAGDELAAELPRRDSDVFLPGSGERSESEGLLGLDSMEGGEFKVRYRRGRAATLDELSELMHEVTPRKDALTRTRSLSSPLKPPRPRSMSAVDEDEHVMVDGLTYRQTMQDITTLKTLLHKLKRCLNEDDISLLEQENFRKGMRAGSFGSEGSLLDSDSGSLKRKPSQRSNPDSSRHKYGDENRKISDFSVTSLGADDVIEENYSLRQSIACLRRDLEERDHTIHLLQQQMTKYSDMYDTASEKSYHVVSTQTDHVVDHVLNTPTDDASKAVQKVSSKVPEITRPIIKVPSTLPQPKLSLPQSSSVSDMLIEISRKSSEGACKFRRKLSHVETSLSDLTGHLKTLSTRNHATNNGPINGMRRGHSMSILPNGNHNGKIT